LGTVYLGPSLHFFGVFIGTNGLVPLLLIDQGLALLQKVVDDHLLGRQVMERQDCVDEAFELGPRRYSELFLDYAAPVEHIYTWRDAKFHELLQFFIYEIFIEYAEPKLAFRFDEHFLERKLNLLALLTLLLSIKDDNRILVRRDILPELPSRSDPLLSKAVLGQDPFRQILLLLLS